MFLARSNDSRNCRLDHNFATANDERRREGKRGAQGFYDIKRASNHCNESFKRIRFYGGRDIGI